jgi:hypothetical protein
MADRKAAPMVPLEIRAPVALGASPLATAGVAAALGIAGAVLFASVMTRFGLEGGGSVTTLGFATRVAVVASLSLGYALGIWLWTVREQHRDFVELGIEEDAGQDPASLYPIPAGPLRASRRAGLAGVAFFVATIEVPNALAGARFGVAWASLHNMSYMLLLGVVFFWVIGRVAYFSTSRKRVVGALDRLPIDLLDRRPLRVFGRAALRNAFTWVAGSAIAALAFVNPELRIADSLLVLVPVSAAALAIGTTAMLLPLRGIHSRIVEAKRDELVRVEAAIGGDGDALAGTRIADRQPSPSLADLIAYRDLIDRLPEWPLDASSFRRLGLYALIPIGSWIGGALVERAVGLALD